MSKRMSKDMSENGKMYVKKMSEDMSERMSKDMSEHVFFLAASC